MSECPDAAVASVGFVGDVCADVPPSARPCNAGTGAGRGASSFALPPLGTGIASDFQYVSTAPPISSFTPLNGVITLTSNDTCTTNGE